MTPFATSASLLCCSIEAVSKHRTQVYRWLLRFVGNEAQAEDILSEVFLDVWRQADRFEARSSVSTWILSIARFKALSARRRRPEAELDETIEATLVDPSDDPALALEKKSQGEMLGRALGELSSDHREIIDLVYYHSLAGDGGQLQPTGPLTPIDVDARPDRNSRDPHAVTQFEHSSMGRTAALA